MNRKAIAGIWKLTPTTAAALPMKEFTVYPKKTKKQIEDMIPELLLMLKEDGSFQQYAASSGSTAMTADASLEDADKRDIDSSWSDFKEQTIKKNQQQQQQQQLLGVIKGTWDYLDGHLILAADRPDDDENSSSNRLYSTLADGYDTSAAVAAAAGITTATNQNEKPKKEDTLLKGRVVASYQTRLQNNPALAATNATQTTTTASTAIDTHLSVPKGSINIGKFFYPRHHPSFFEQPMFQPVKRGTFALRQVLGSLNTERDDDDDDAQRNNVVEKFQRSDFYNKTFLLTSHPIGQQRQQPKGDLRWSIKYNEFVHDPPSKSSAAKKAEEDAKNSKLSVTGIRVLQVAFHANNTFSTTAGLGESAILRGKFDVIGAEKDHLWMQVIRFGFGRSVSGSVYSEGRMLSHEDAKAYWGTIRNASGEDGDNKQTTASDDADTQVVNEVGDESQASAEKPLRIEVKGSVLDGWGLEPLPVASFIMRETSSELDMVDDDEEEEDEEMDDEALSEEMGMLDPGLQDDGVDWSSPESDGSFQ